MAHTLIFFDNLFMNGETSDTTVNKKGIFAKIKEVWSPTTFIQLTNTTAIKYSKLKNI